MHISRLVAACGALALVATAASAEKTRTKSNNTNERVASEAQPSEDVSLLWGSSEVHAVSATATPVTGSDFSFGATNYPSSSTAKTGHVTINRRTVAPGPGSMTIALDGAPGGTCPVSYDSMSPIKGVGVVIKKNPGSSTERYALDGVTVSRCDASSLTIGYQSMAINEKR